MDITALISYRRVGYAWKECLKAEFRSCCIDINRREEDSRDAKQKMEETFLFLLTRTGQ